MTLDEAIIHFEKEAEEQMQRIDNLSDIPRFGSSDEDIKLIEKCEECAEEHRQLAEWLKDYKRLKEPCEDAISRREAIKIFTYNYKGERIPDYDCDNFPVQIAIKKVKKMLRELPPVKPQERTGHWIDDGYYADNSNESVWRCSECDHHIIEYDMQGYKFCHNCGCRMVGDDNENSD